MVFVSWETQSQSYKPRGINIWQCAVFYCVRNAKKLDMKLNFHVARVIDETPKTFIVVAEVSIHIRILKIENCVPWKVIVVVNIWNFSSVKNNVSIDFLENQSNC